MHRATISSRKNIPVSSLSVKKVSNCVVTRSQLVVTPFGVHPSCLFENLPPKFRFKMHLIGAGSVIKNKLRCLPKRLDYYFL
ncbi:MAG: hypothetical protein J5I65_16375, partial [Aridibacter famidurans]|nr:hypothetical protein [Aridibacter famidurans]